MRETIVLCADRTEEQARRIHAYLLDQFPLASDAGLIMRPTTPDDPPYLRSAGWLGVIPDGERWERYTGTLDKMRQAVSDYEAGYAAGLAARSA
jgi:hypothetical protein